MAYPTWGEFIWGSSHWGGTGLMPLVYDRIAGAYYNASDLNRVENNMEYLEQKLNDFGFNISLTIKTDWIRNDLGQLGAQALMEQYRQNVVHIRATIMQQASTPQTPNSIRFLTYQEANDIEKILADVEGSLNRMVNTFFYSNEVTSGEG